MLVEPACGTALCAVYNHSEMNLDATFGIAKDKTGNNNGPIIVVVCGGSMASIQLFQEWKEQLGITGIA